MRTVILGLIAAGFIAMPAMAEEKAASPDSYHVKSEEHPNSGLHYRRPADPNSPVDVKAGSRMMDDGRSRIRNADRFEEDKVDRTGNRTARPLESDLGDRQKR